MRRIWKARQHLGVLAGNLREVARMWIRDWAWRSDCLEHEWRVRKGCETDLPAWWFGEDN